MSIRSQKFRILQIEHMSADTISFKATAVFSVRVLLFHKLTFETLKGALHQCKSCSSSCNLLYGSENHFESVRVERQIDTELKMPISPSVKEGRPL